MNQPLNPRLTSAQKPKAPSPAPAGDVQTPIDFGDALLRIMTAVEAIAICMERRAVKDGVMQEEDCEYEVEPTSKV